MSTPQLDFWFEYASTYSYPAAMRVERVAAAHGCKVRYRPLLLGPIFRAQGWNDSPFNIYPAKGRYMWRDLERTCEELSIPFQRPSQFPRNGLLAARVTLAAEDEAWLPELVRNVYTASFAHDRDIADRAVLRGCLQGLTEDPDVWLRKAETPEIKAKLRARCDEADQLGIFGAPSFIVNDELFWGNDRLETALRWATARLR